MNRPAGGNAPNQTAGKKILWLGDAGCTTGFGRVTHSIGERLVRDYGYEVEVLAINYMGDYYPSILDPEQGTLLKLYRPDKFSGDDTRGMTRVMELVGHDPDVIVMLNDPHVIISDVLQNPYDALARQPDGRPTLMTKPLLMYVPCDGYELPQQWTKIIPQLGTVVCMAKHGLTQYEDATLIYHGVDKDTFWPVSQDRPIKLSNGEVIRSKREAKKALGLDPKGFLVLRVDSNSGRKDYGSTVKALAPFMRRHADVQVWMHCAQNGENALNLPLAWNKWGDEFEGRIFYPDLHSTFSGWPESDLNAVYNAADVFMSTSRGEGFGLTLAEAAMAGLPIVAQNVSSIPEVVGPGGLLLEPAMRLTVPSGEDVCLASPDSFTNALERLYESAGLRRDLGKKGREHVLSTFSWDTAAKQFDELIQGLVTSERPEET